MSENTSKSEQEQQQKKQSDIEKYQVIRGYVILTVAVILIIYGIVPPVDPAIFTFGGAMLGITPVARAAA